MKSQSKQRELTYQQPARQPASFTTSLPSSHFISSPSDSLSNPEATQERTNAGQSLSRSDSVPRPHAIPLTIIRNRSYDRSTSPASTTSQNAAIHSGECRSIITRSFAPRISVYASSETEAFIRQKGFQAGLSGFLRPFGEHVQGNVVIRDSIGGSRAWSDFGVKFFDPEGQQKTNKTLSTTGDNRGSATSSSRIGLLPAESQPMEEMLSQYLERQGSRTSDAQSPASDWAHPQSSGPPEPSQVFQKYLRTLLSEDFQAPHETLCHPVACLIAVSSRNEAPIEALRNLYTKTGSTSPSIPPWISTEYLRYYVLVHDEENDDIAKSTALFDLMKRHFGLHCHLLRLRSSQCIPTDDDSILVPLCEWVSAREEVTEVQSDGESATLGISNQLRLTQQH